MFQEKSNQIIGATFTTIDITERLAGEKILLEAKQKAEVAFDTVAEVKKTAVADIVDLPLTELIRLEDAVSDPRAKFHFKATKKGGLRVYIQEIK